MKVLFITHYGSMYGANRSLLRLIHELREYGIEPIVICPTNGEFEKHLKSMEIKHYIFPYYSWVSKKGSIARYFIKSLLNFNGIRKMMRIAYDEKVNIIHTNSSLVYIGAIVAKLLNLKHIWHIREYILGDYELKFDKGWRSATKKISDSSDYVIAISDYIYNKFDSFIDSKKLVKIYNGVSIDYKFTSEEKSVNNNNNLRLVIVGSIIPSKGQKDAILAVDYLYKNKGISTHLDIVGNGTYQTTLEQLVKDLEITELVTFTGYKENVLPILRNSDVALMCSISEAFGRTTVEAMQSSLPVIGAKAGATLEIIVDNETGFFYEPGDYKDLAEKISTFIDNRKLLTLFGENGKKRVEEKFLSTINTKKILELYKDLMTK